MSLKDRIRSASASRARADVSHLFPAGALNGERVYVGEMTAAAADALDESNFKVRRDSRGKARQDFLWRGVRARYLARCLCDESGQPIFDPESEADIATLSGLGKATADALYQAARRVNGERDEGEQGGDPFAGAPDESPSSG